MTDLRELFEQADRIPAPTEWPELESVLPRPLPGGGRGRVVAAAVSLLVFAAAIGLASWAFLGHRGAQPAGVVPQGRIAFVAEAGPTGGDIYVMSADGRGVRKLTGEPSGSQPLNDAPAWSPNGREIAYGKNKSAIVVMGADGSRPREIDHNYCGGEDDPTWSPDGTKIAFVAQNPCAERSGVYVISADGTGARLLVQGGSQPAWSPDGRRIAFTRFQTEDLGAIYVINVDGSGLRRLTNSRRDLGFPSWSPDGRQIAASGGRPEGIYVMAADGTGLHLVGANGFDPAWSPDGRRIAFTRYAVQPSSCPTSGLGTPLPCPSPPPLDRLFVMNADGSGLHELPVGLTQPLCCPSWGK
jgi:Tol biopolymer transport system component